MNILLLPPKLGEISHLVTSRRSPDLVAEVGSRENICQWYREMEQGVRSFICSDLEHTNPAQNWNQWKSGHHKMANFKYNFRKLIDFLGADGPQNKDRSAC